MFYIVHKVLFTSQILYKIFERFILRNDNIIMVILSFAFYIQLN